MAVTIIPHGEAQKVWVLRIEYESGCNIDLFATELPEDQDKAIELYFELMTEHNGFCETYELEHQVINK